MIEGEVKKCPKCASESISKKNVWLTGFWGSLDRLNATAYACDKCGYIELYKTPSTYEAFVKKCAKCGKEIPIASEYCPGCGAKQKEKGRE